MKEARFGLDTVLPNGRTVKDLLEESGIPYALAASRVAHGMSRIEACTKPRTKPRALKFGAKRG